MAAPADGSATWQRHHGRTTGFFPLHDLTHYAVETELGFRRGFCALIADGWDIADTGERPTRGPLPQDAVAVEHIVGLLDVQRASGSVWTADELNEEVAGLAAAHQFPRPRAFADGEWTRVRTRLHELFARWAVLPPGATLELTFDRASASPHVP